MIAAPNFPGYLLYLGCLLFHCYQGFRLIQMSLVNQTHRRSRLLLAVVLGY
jgi:hypothetical protein